MVIIIANDLKFLRKLNFLQKYRFLVPYRIIPTLLALSLFLSVTKGSKESEQQQTTFFIIIIVANWIPITWKYWYSFLFFKIALFIKGWRWLAPRGFWYLAKWYILNSILWHWVLYETTQTSTSQRPISKLRPHDLILFSLLFN